LLLQSVIPPNGKLPQKAKITLTIEGEGKETTGFLNINKYVWKFYFPTDSIYKTTLKQGSETKK
jgi:hypothetical protein